MIGDDAQVTPRWSLHRLLELKILSCYPCYAVQFYKGNVDNAYECLINNIEWLIEEGLFNKEYLENGKDKTDLPIVSCLQRGI